MFDRLRKIFTKPAAPPEPEPIKTWSARRWEAARTNRLNSAHWGGVTESSINADLLMDLKTLRQRCEFETARNPYLAGVRDTHVTDLVGATGPILQLEKVGGSPSGAEKKWLDAAEDVWSRWWEMPDINEVLSGPDLLAMSFGQLWDNGEWLWQKTTDKGAKGIKLRLNAIAPRRLEQPAIGGTASMTTVMGIERNANGKPLAYWIQKSVDELSLMPSLDYERVPAADIVHFYRIDEPGQLRGVPFAATALHVIADLRDADDDIQAAIRQAANFAVYLWTQEADNIQIFNESTEIERGMQSTLPPGYQATMVKPEQPSTPYLDYRRERLAEIGRPIGMPGMMVWLDSREHNYSSARFDGQLYQRGNKRLQGGSERRALNPLVEDVLYEADLAEMIQGKRPERIRMVWTWPVPPHVDPQKEATAEDLAMRNGALTFQSACAARGFDYENVIEQLGSEAQKFAAKGLKSPYARAIEEVVPPEPEADGDTIAELIEEALADA